MKKFWDAAFEKEKTNWGFVPADSALIARDLFLKNNLKKILIPGIGYGRNAMAFLNKGFDITGIEISKKAIELARANNLVFPIHLGSVVDMPFDNSIYDGIYCYALVHLLNMRERKKCIKDCYDQLAFGGMMVFMVASTKMEMYSNGKLISKDRYKIMKGLNVFFYNHESVEKEFKDFGLIEFREFEEPIKHMKDANPIACFLVTCKKMLP
ncbi:MAG: SAM-dependent methyltransferase [Bacteroidetes bacterium HGW-Bacteroidetes-17]|jgi:SAM-dependent methyltransferase|nr:MAG: SAM-dependent methyltransferase [Bacteroidetes bacterium HGW-Bacteroidetes-17]